MLTLEFLVPVFNNRINTTCRRGDKYGSLRPGGEVDLRETGGESFGLATIRRVTVVCFMDIRHSDIEHEHDPTCRTIEGLYAEIKRVYPGFQRHEVVTLIEMVRD